MPEAKTKFPNGKKQIQPSSFNGVPLDLLKKDQNSDLIFKKYPLCTPDPEEYLKTLSILMLNLQLLMIILKICVHFCHKRGQAP